MADVATLVSLLALLLPVPTEKSPGEPPKAAPPAMAGEGLVWHPIPPAPLGADDLLLPALTAPEAPAVETRGAEPERRLAWLESAPGTARGVPTLAEIVAHEPAVAEAPREELIDSGPFSRGRLLFEANCGAYFSQPGVGPRTPTFDFAPVNLRLGIVLNDPCLPGWWRGSFEALAEFSTAPVVSGFGDIVVGPTALLRYNWVQPDCRLVPYLQGGAGFAYNNAYEDRAQRAIGEAIEFTLKAAVGCHYLINDHVSVDVEGGFTHISNADLASRNLGINALGGSIGITFYFPCGRN